MDDNLEDRLPQLPEPPPMPRRIRLHPFQWILVPIVFLGPVILALSGVLGESRVILAGETESFDVIVQYPTRLRYKQPSVIRIAIERHSLGPLDTLTISLDSTYASQFTDVRGIPQLERPYSLKLATSRTGERVNALLEILGEHAGIHTGDLVVSSRDSIRLRLRTVVFP
jgi:hypothetical protein